MSIDPISAGQFAKGVNDGLPNQANLGNIQSNVSAVSDLERMQFENGLQLDNLNATDLLKIQTQDILQQQAALDPNLKVNTTPGDNIIQTVQNVRDQYMQIENNIKSITSKGSDLSSADLMQLQFEVMQLSYMNELSSKAVDKMNNIGQTLMRNQ
ncbi:MAG: hypothetical protein LBB20_01770 [Puniceicoccales bacterium]|jgi:hypothetical protein|nr:hypothetical protein [Puniceicoccales bacterium]